MPRVARVRSPVVLAACLAAVGWGWCAGTAGAAARGGTVYTQTNTAPQNYVVVFDRAADGRLVERERVVTGGVGSTSNPPFGFPILDSQGPVELTADRRLLLVVNAGSDTVTSFRIRRDGSLRRVDVESSGGDLPVSVDSRPAPRSRRGRRAGTVLYVLNELSGDIVGLRADRRGELRPIAGSERSLSTAGPAGVAAQVGFDRRGRTLTVTQRGTNTIDTFRLRRDGRAYAARATPAGSANPFGFEYDARNRLFVANAGPLDTFAGSASSFQLLRRATLQPLTTIPTGQNATCWTVVTRAGRFAFMTNTLSNSVSRLRIAGDGSLALLGQTATSSGFPSDLALSRDDRYLYVLVPVIMADASVIDAYRVGRDGSLTPIGSTPATLPAGVSGLAVR